jgi:hypothetical protein
VNGQVHTPSPAAARPHHTFTPQALPHHTFTPEALPLDRRPSASESWSAARASPVALHRRPSRSPVWQAARWAEAAEPARPWRHTDMVGRASPDRSALFSPAARTADLPADDSPGSSSRGHWVGGGVCGGRHQEAPATPACCSRSCRGQSADSITEGDRMDSGSEEAESPGDGAG